MNLTSIFRKDAAIVDHAWMRDGIVHPGQPQLDISGMKNPNNVKPQLEVEWGGGGPTVDLDEPAGKVRRNLPESAEGDAGPVVLSARDMMNRGFSTSKVVAALRRRYGTTVLKGAKGGLTELFKLDGVVGRLAVDGRGYRSCKEALKAASRSPYKRFIRYVVGCECGSPHMMPPGGPGTLADVPSTGNPMDDFLASSESGGCVKVAHCRSTMLPVLSTVGDLDPSELDSTLVEMMNVTSLPQSVRDQVAGMKTSNLAKLAAVFRWLDRHMEAADTARYADKGSNAEFRVARADTAVEIDGVPQAGIDVGLVDPSDREDFDVDGEPVSTELGGMDRLVGVFDDVDLAGQPDQSQIPVDMVDKDDPSRIGLFDALEPVPQLDVGFGGRKMPVSAPDLGGGDVELSPFDGQLEVPLDDETELLGEIPVDRALAPMEVDVGAFSPQDVEPGQFLEPEFEGTDEVVVEERPNVTDELGVEMLPGEDDESMFLADDQKG